MQGNVSYMVPNVAMMSFVSYFFSGFVCLKMPFSMPSTHFKVAKLAPTYAYFTLL